MKHLTTLVKLAQKLDEEGQYKTADIADSILARLSQMAQTQQPVIDPNHPIPKAIAELRQIVDTKHRNLDQRLQSLEQQIAMLTKNKGSDILQKDTQGNNIINVPANPNTFLYAPQPMENLTIDASGGTPV